MKQLQGTFSVRWVPEPVPGPAAVVYKLQPSATQIKKEKDGSFSPSVISCDRLVKIGDEPQAKTSEGVLYYQFSNGRRTRYSSGISVLKGAEWLVFDWLIDNSSVDRITVQILADGKDGMSAFVADSDNDMIPAVIDRRGLSLGREQVVSLQAFYGADPVTAFVDFCDFEVVDNKGQSATSLVSVAKAGASSIRITVIDGQSWYVTDKVQVTVSAKHPVYGVAKTKIDITPLRPGPDGKPAILYQVKPMPNAIAFTRDEHNMVQGEQRIHAEVIKIEGRTETVVTDNMSALGLVTKYEDADGAGFNEFNPKEGVLVEGRSIEDGYFHSVDILLEHNGVKVDMETVPCVVDGNNGANGHNAFVVDSDEDVIPVSVNENGDVSGENPERTVHLSAYFGSAHVTDVSFDFVISKESAALLSVTRISASAFRIKAMAGGNWLGLGKGQVTFSCQHNIYGQAATRISVLPLYPGPDGKPAILYQVKPAPNAIAFSRGENGLVEGSQTVKVDVVRVVGDTEENVTEKLASLGLIARYKRQTSEKGVIFHPELGEAVTVGGKSVDEGQREIIIVLERADGTLLDSETVPCLVDGAKGDRGDKGDTGDDGKDQHVNLLDRTSLRGDLQKVWNVFDPSNTIKGGDGKFGTNSVYANNGKSRSVLDVMQQQIKGGYFDKIAGAQWYTLSFWAKGTSVSTYIYGGDGAIDVNAGCLKDGIADTIPSDGHIFWSVQSQEWKHCVLTFRTKSVISSVIHLLFRLGDSSDICLSAMKLENGRYATDWNYSSFDIKGAELHTSDWEAGRYYQAGKVDEDVHDVIFFRESEGAPRKAASCIKSHVSSWENKPGTAGGKAYWDKADNLKFIATDLALARKIKAEEIESDSLIVQNLKTEGREKRSPSVEISDGIIRIYGESKTFPSFMAGLDEEGNATLSFYNQAGTKLYDLGPSGISQISVVPEKYTEQKLVLLPSFATEEYYRLAKNPSGGTSYFTFSSKYTQGVIDQSTKQYNGKTFVSEDYHSALITDGLYTRAKLPGQMDMIYSDPVHNPMPKPTMMYPEMQGGYFVNWNNSIVYMRKIYRYSNGICVETFIFYFN